MSEWQPIETVPKDGTPILALCRRGQQMVVQWFQTSSRNAFWSSIPGCWQKEPTHWMPLPQPLND